MKGRAKYNVSYIYEFSISMQLSGALILLLWCFSKISTNAIDMCFPGVIFAKRKDSGEPYIEKGVIQNKVKTIFLNMCAFVYISIGYLVSVFAENDMEKPWCKLLLIVVMTIIFLSVAYLISRYMSAAWGREDRLLSEEEIEKYNIPTEISEHEIEGLFE